MRDENESDEVPTPKIHEMTGPVALLLTQAKLVEQRARDAERSAIGHREDATALERHALELREKVKELRAAAQALTP